MVGPFSTIDPCSEVYAGRVKQSGEVAVITCSVPKPPMASSARAEESKSREAGVSAGIVVGKTKNAATARLPFRI